MPGLVSVGFYGKLPARGDFVRAGLSRAFVDPWDDWAATVLPASRAAMGEAWVPAWLEAPVWRFRLAAGICGPDAVLGVMLPSVDRVGRYFPLTLAALFGPGCRPPACAHATAWLDRCECAGRSALEDDATPETLSALMTVPDEGDATDIEASLWWTDGAPRVEATQLSLAALPDPALFTAMLGGDAMP